MPSYKPVAEPRKGSRKYLTFAEMRALSATAAERGPYETVLVRLLYEVALRAGEVGALRLDHCKRLHLSPPQLYLPRAKGSTSGWQTVTVELACMLQQWIQQHHEVNDATRLARQDPARYVFPGVLKRGRIAKGVSRIAVWRTVKELCLEAGVDESVAHPHALRHARATHLFMEAERQGLEAQAALKTVAKLLGHRTAKTSWEHYVAETGRGKEIAEDAFRRATEEDYD